MKQGEAVGDETQLGQAHTWSAQVAEARQLLRQAQQVAVLTGAGISTESGIPDFRSPGGVWQRHKPPTYPEFCTRHEARQAYWQLRHELHGVLRAAQPNAGHLALTRMVTQGKVMALITQNVDGLHQKAGTPAAQVIELHGTACYAACLTCGRRSSMDARQREAEQTQQPPLCPMCGGYVKAATILFGQKMPAAELAQAIAIAESCDLFLVVGSSLRVQPAARLPQLASRRGAPLVIINLEATPLDSRAAVVIHARAGEVLPELAGPYTT